jgi:hypothetical protein
MQVDPKKLSAEIKNLNPRAVAVETSCRDGLGIAEVIGTLGL